MLEEEAVAELGSVSEVTAQIVANIPLGKLVRERMASRQKSRRLNAWKIVLLILGAPLWLSLVIAALAIVLAIYIALWSIVLALWAAEIEIGAGALGSVVCCIFFVVRGFCFSRHRYSRGGTILCRYYDFIFLVL